MGRKASLSNGVNMDEFDKLNPPRRNIALIKAQSEPIVEPIIEPIIEPKSKPIVHNNFDTPPTEAGYYILYPNYDYTCRICCKKPIILYYNPTTDTWGLQKEFTLIPVPSMTSKFFADLGTNCKFSKWDFL